jgi:transcriptional regulator with XRE-family HTH domain
MAKEQKFSEIIDRIEYVRERLSMNKSRFSSAIGMKPQTYNNFIGPQGSKPNIELLLGMLNVYHVNPYWLLNGTGEIFLESSPDRENLKFHPSPAGESSNSNKRLPRLRKKSKVTG